MDRDQQPSDQAPIDAALGALFWRTRDAVVVADVGTGRIVRWNPAAESIFGYTAAEALALSLSALLPGHGQPWIGWPGDADAAVAQIDGDHPIIARRRSGETFAAEASISLLNLIDDAESRYVLAIIRDVSERSRIEAERAALATEYAGLLETSHTLQVVAAAIASVRDMDALLPRIVDHAMAALGADGCAVWMFDEAQVPRLNATRGLSDAFHHRLAAVHSRQIAAGTAAALTGEPSFVRNFAEVVGAVDPDFAETLRREGLVSGLRLPLREPDGQVAGWLTLYHRCERLYREEEVRLAQAFTDQITVALRNARLAEQERVAREDAGRRLERVTALARITEQLLGMSDSDMLLGVVVEAAARLSGAESSEVCLIEAGGRRLRSVAAHGPHRPSGAQPPAGWGDTATKDAVPVIRRAIEQHRAVVIDDAKAGPDTGPARSPADSVHACIAAPVLAGGVPIGVLWVGDAAPRRFSAEDVAIVQALADLAALAIEHARLVERDRETAVLEERARLARDLHDSVTQSIFSLGMLAGAAQAQHARGAPALGATLARVGQVAQEALAEMRALLVTLRPVALDEVGLAGALEKLAASFQTRSGLAIDCHVLTEARPVPEIETAIYRIVQEALANIVKHAQATEARVTLAEADGSLIVTVTDNGRGFDPDASPGVSTDGRRGGMGVRSMRERAATAGIALEIASAPGAGATITLTAPCSLDHLPDVDRRDPAQSQRDDPSDVVRIPSDT